MPENVDGLKPVRINEILYQKLPMRAKINDQCFWGINSYFTHRVGPLISMLDQLVTFEAELAMAKPKHVGATGTTLNIEGSTVVSMLPSYVIFWTRAVIYFARVMRLRFKKENLGSKATSIEDIII